MLLKDSINTLVFSSVLGIVCSLLLTGASLFTLPYRSSNEKAEELRNFLEALEVPVPEDADSKQLIEVFDKNINKKILGERDIYEYVPENSKSATPVAIAVPFSGPGLWGAIDGVIAFEGDFTTIRGIRFYKQEETPGLGGEIGSKWFQEQFIGKQIVSSKGDPGFRILKSGQEADRNTVDGITGATMTSDRVQYILDKLTKELWEQQNTNEQ
jgi:Na+-transporting NADH:ubiquinone oxidoreductase subunit C